MFVGELKGLRTGRATPAMLDSIRADYYGSPTPIKNIANISCPDPSTIMIKPFQADDLKEIERRCAPATSASPPTTTAR